MNKKLNILFIPRWYPNRVSPLNGIFIQRHALAVAMKHHVSVLFVNADPGMKDKIYDISSAEEQGIFTVRVYYNNSGSTIAKFFRYVKACRMGLALIRAKVGQPDLAHIHVLSRTFIPAWLLKVPFIISEQWSGYLPEDGTYRGFLKKRLTRMAVRRAAAVTTVSESLKNAMLSHGLSNNYSVVPNVVDTNLFGPSGRINSNGKYILLHVSNLDDRAKNVSGMIRAVKKVVEKRSDVEFQIVGDGAERGHLERLAADLGILNRNIFFMGTRSSHEVAELMKKADLFLLYSNYDNMPCVMVESMSSGLPVIGSSIHGIGEHVKDGRGIVVEPGNDTVFAGAILEGINKLSSFDKMKLHNYANEHFSYAAVGERFDQIYQKALKI